MALQHNIGYAEPYYQNYKEMVRNYFIENVRNSRQVLAKVQT